MADRSAIEWTDATWNPLRGCSRASEGCRHCYAERMAARFAGEGQTYEGLIHPSTHGWNGKVQLVSEALTQPLHWTRPRRIFVNSMSDLFHEAVPDEWIDQIFAIMALAPQHTFQVLTKRAERMHRYMEARRPEGWTEGYIRLLFERPARAFPSEFERLPLNNDTHMPWPLPNVWLGVSVENQAAADERIPFLLQTPAAVRWLSCEPLLGPINFRWTPYAYQATGQTYREYLNDKGTINQFESLRKINWIVVGGETGPGSRPMHPAWARALRDQCAAAGVPFYFKQWGDHVEWTGAESFSPSCRMPDMTPMVRVGKKAAGRLLDGVLHDVYPNSTGAHP